MQTIWVPVLLTLAISAAAAAERPDRDVVVYLHHGVGDAAVVANAEARAGRILAAAGVDVAWRHGRPAPHGRAEVIEADLAPYTDPAIRPGSLAFSTLGPQTGSRIRVFFDRVRACGPPEAVAAILAHVLAHEIAHVLLNEPRHSATGIMQAHWGPSDFLQMRRHALPFAPEDLRLWEAWAARRHRTLLAESR